MNHLSAIRTFVSAADYKSFSAAAKALNIEVSTVSRHISELEEYLQVTLFNRSTRGLALTETGAFFYSHAQQLLLQWEETRQLTSALDKQPSGLLRLSVPSTFGRLHVMPFVDEFLRLHPNISLDISFNDEVQDLIEARIDLSIRIGILPDSSIHARKLAQRLLPVEQWKGIIAVSRGGLVPAALLARELSIRYVDTVCISSYDHDHQREMNVLKRAEGDGEGFIVIDDLVDTGGTAQAIREMYPKARFVTIFAKPAGAPLVDDYVVDIPQNTWIEQPWDMGVAFIPPIVNR